MKRILNCQTGAEKKLVRKTNMAKMFLFGIDTKVFKKEKLHLFERIHARKSIITFFCFLSSLYIYIILCTTALFFGYFFNKKKEFMVHKKCR